MLALFTKLKELLKDLIFPAYCLRCGSEGEFVCSNCLSKLNLTKQRCIECGKPSKNGFTHPHCLKPLGAERLLSIYSYQDPAVAKILITAKYKFLPEVFTIFGNELARLLDAQLPQNSVIVPIPLTNKRLRWRGFNQAEILAKTLAEELHMDWANALKKTKNTKPQKELDREKRIQNISGVFSIAPNVSIESKHILLIDDVITTGATLREAAATLKANGAKTVWCITLAQD